MVLFFFCLSALHLFCSEDSTSKKNYFAEESYESFDHALVSICKGCNTTGPSILSTLILQSITPEKEVEIREISKNKRKSSVISADEAKIIQKMHHHYTNVLIHYNSIVPAPNSIKRRK